MKTLTFLAKTTVFGALALANALPVFAETSTVWNWTDASSAISERQNRPIWALGYTNTGWIATDGIAFNRGGHVWKTDGVHTTDLTALAASAGLERVDAIVDDGANAVLLENPGSANFNGAYYDGSFRNFKDMGLAQYKPKYWGWGTIYPINGAENKLEEDEGIASIAGKNGTWIILSTKGNIFEWNPSLISIVKRPTFINNVRYGNTLQYTLTQDTADIAPTAILPLTYGWLIVLPSTFYPTESQYYVYANGGISDITYSFPEMKTLSVAASNGNQALLIGANRNDPQNVVAYTYNSIVATRIKNMFISKLSRTDWLGAQIAWSGKTWVLFAHKNGFRIENDTLASTGLSRDYFVTLSSDRKGTIFAGGARSLITSVQPTAPLTAKLVRLTESTSFQTNIQIISAPTKPNNISGWSWTTPHVTELRMNEKTTYTVGAWSPAGINYIDVMANGLLLKHCAFYGAQGNHECAIDVNGSDYASLGLIALQGVIIDGDSNKIGVSETTIAVKKDIYTTALTPISTITNTNAITVWGWFEPQAYVARNGIVSFRAQAQAGSGLAHSDIYINGYLRKSCSYNTHPAELQDCDVLVFGNEYVEGTYSVIVKAFDIHGNEKDSSNYYITFTSPDTSGNEMVSVAAIVLAPNKAKFMSDDSTTYTVQAADKDGIVKIEILVDWDVAMTCNTGNTYSTASCSLLFEGYKNYGKDHVIISRITDTRGNIIWTGMKRISFADSRNTNARGIVWTTPNADAISADKNSFIGATAYANTDTRTIELFLNGVSTYTCSYESGINEKNCSTLLNATGYASNAPITIQAKMTNSAGYSFMTDTRTIHIAANTGGLYYGNVPTVFLWSSRNGESATITANADSYAGVNTIQMTLNGNLVQTCTRQTTCTWTGYIGPSNATYSAKMIDLYGREVWSGYNTIAKQ